MEPRKQAILTALSAFFNQRPGFDPRNYDRAGYLADSRKVQRQRRDAQTLLMAVWRIDEIDADALLAASERAFSGRLTLEENAPVKTGHIADATLARNARSYAKPRVVVEYCTGQYWCTEFRAAACAVLASALWDYAREHSMPATIGDKVAGSTCGPSKGDWLRAHFRSQFGRGIASRWFS